MSLLTTLGSLTEFLDEKILFLDRKIRTFDPVLQKLLQSIPGIASQTASTCVAEIGNIERFPHAKALTAYIGLDSRVYESGTSIHGATSGSGENSLFFVPGQIILLNRGFMV